MKSFSWLGAAGWLLALGIVVWYFPVVLVCVLPGLLVGFHPLAKKFRTLELCTFIIIISLASIIILFGLLKFIPVSFTTAVRSLFVVSGTAGIWLSQRRSFHLKLVGTDAIELLILLPLVVLFGQWYFVTLVPAGADMATHSYIAKTIEYYNTFPQTYYPIVPIQRFGFESVGMPSVMAIISLFTELPLHRVAVLTSVVLYPLVGLLMFNFLRSFFSIPLAGIAVYGLFFINFNFTSLLTFGAFPTVLGILFFITAVYAAKIMIEEQAFTTLNAAGIAILLAASLLSHLTPIIAGAYFMSIVLAATVYAHYRSAAFRRFGFTVVVLTIVFCANFLTSIKPLSVETYNYLKDWQQNQSLLAVIDENVLLTTPEYIRMKTGDYWSLLILIGVLIGLVTLKRPETKWFLSCLGVYTVVLINVDYWFLPLSPALYPGRITATGTFFFTYFATLALDTFRLYLMRFITQPISLLEKVFKFGLLSVIVVFISLHTIEVMTANYRSLSALFREQTSVTDDDIYVMTWISQHTSEDDVIENNYGDAGIWIPAIAGRRVLHNDASPHSFDALGRNIADLTPTYAFIGSKQLYPDHVYLTASIAAERGYVLATQSGQAQLYKIPPIRE